MRVVTKPLTLGRETACDAVAVGGGVHGVTCVLADPRAFSVLRRSRSFLRCPCLLRRAAFTLVSALARLLGCGGCCGCVEGLIDGLYRSRERDQRSPQTTRELGTQLIDT